MKAGVPLPEARLLCLLEMLGPEPLIDVDRTNIDGLQSSINRQIASQDLRLPFRFGRTLYDKFNELHKDVRNSLTTKETFDLLNGTPQGVFQVDEYVSGPYGLLSSATHRFLGPTMLIPLQHCSDLSCSAIHRIALDTGRDASINENRGKIVKMLERDGVWIDTWFSFFDTFASRYSDSDDAYGEPLITLIGDALTDEEIKILLAWLLDNTGGVLRQVASTVGLSGSSNAMVKGLNRTKIMQLACTCDDPSLVAGLDTLVRSDKILVPACEIRSAVVNGEARYGRYGLFAELSHLGVRLRSTNSPIAPLRLRRLVEKMYNLELESDRHELLWQLRAREEESIERRLQRHMQSENPREIVEKARARKKKQRHHRQRIPEVQ